MGMVMVGYGKNALPFFSGGLAGCTCGGILQQRRDNPTMEMIRLSDRSGVTGEKERLRLSDRSGVTGEKERLRLSDRSGVTGEKEGEVI
jgi:hypothetical protein